LRSKWLGITSVDEEVVVIDERVNCLGNYNECWFLYSLSNSAACSKFDLGSQCHAYQQVHNMSIFKCPPREKYSSYACD
jgi:hypothetical protein